MSEIIVTDDFKICVNKAIQAFKSFGIYSRKNFTSSIKYILKELKYEEYDVFALYLFEKLRVELQNEQNKGNDKTA